MKTVTIQRFYGGMANDVYDGTPEQFSITKHFDILGYTNRLQPFRGMVSDTASTGIGNIIVASDGLMYAVGTNAGNGRLWQRSGYGATDVWQHIPTTDQLSGFGVVYPLLVEYKDGNSARNIWWASTGKLVNSDKAGASSANVQNLTFTNIGQGFVHPKDKILYIPYTTSSACLIGTITSANDTFNTAQLTLPSQYQIPCLTNFGNYLAIPAYASSGAAVNQSIVYLWDRDTSLATLTESINWGEGQLQVMNNLDGVLIGISTGSAGFNNSVQDADSIYIKGYSGGTAPFLIKEIIANHLPASSHPVVTINPNVNFVYKNRLYFSVNIVPTDGVSNAYYGLWSVGKNKGNGQYSVTLERMATNDGSETGVLAAAISGDFVAMCHTALGTLTCSVNGQTSSSTYNATSVYESVINPNMPEIDQIYNKSLLAVGVQTQPLLTGQQVVMKYRVDSTGAWTTLFTKTPTSPDTNLTVFEMSLANSTNGTTTGRNIEFRLESTGGAVITGFSYKYDILKSNL